MDGGIDFQPACRGACRGGGVSMGRHGGQAVVASRNSLHDTCSMTSAPQRQQQRQQRQQPQQTDSNTPHPPHEHTKTQRHARVCKISTTASPGHCRGSPHSCTRNDPARQAPHGLSRLQRAPMAAITGKGTNGCHQCKGHPWPPSCEGHQWPPSMQRAPMTAINAKGTHGCHQCKGHQ